MASSPGVFRSMRSWPISRTWRIPRSNINRRHPLASGLGHRRAGRARQAPGPRASPDGRRSRRSSRQQRLDLPARHPGQGCLPPRPDGPAARAFQACSSAGSTRSGTPPRPAWASSGPSSAVDGKTLRREPRPQERPGRLALGERLGQRIRPDTRPGGLPRSPTRSRRSPLAPGWWTSRGRSSRSTRWGRRRRSPRRSSAAGDYVLAPERQPGDAASGGHRLTSTSSSKATLRGPRNR